MTAELLTSSIGVIGALVVAVFTYWSTKRRERDTEWRKEKLVYYKAFIEGLSGVVAGDDTPDGHRKFASATNNLLLFAPQSVIDSLNEFRAEIAISNPNKSKARHDALLAELLVEIRKDLGITPKDDPSSFRAILWTSGQSAQNKSSP